MSSGLQRRYSLLRLWSRCSGEQISRRRNIWLVWLDGVLILRKGGRRETHTTHAALAALATAGAWSNHCDIWIYEWVYRKVMFWLNDCGNEKEAES